MATFYASSESELINHISTANGSSEADTIVLTKVDPDQIYSLTTKYLTTENGLPQITSEITIEGHGATIERSDQATDFFRIFEVTNTGSLTLNDLTVSKGNVNFRNPDTNGGGIVVNSGGMLTINHCIITENEVSDIGGYGGGGIAVFGTAVIVNSVISGNNSANTSLGGGGMIIFGGGKAIVSHTVISDNETEGKGGGVLVYSDVTNISTLIVYDSVISGNVANYDQTPYDEAPGGGGIYSKGVTRIYDSTIKNNHTELNGGAIYNGESLYVRNSLIADNTAAREGGGISSSGYAETQINYNSIINNSGQTWSVRNTSGPHRADATYNWWGSPDGPSGVGPGSGDSISLNVDYGPFLVEIPFGPAHDGDCACPLCYATDDCANSTNPISLRKGEKRLTATDLSLNSPAEPLVFTRSYRQSKQEDPAFQFMGRGWKHNHHANLSVSGAEASVLLSNGTILKLYELTDDYFIGAAGSNASMEYMGDKYILTAPDGSQYVFGHSYDNYWLTERLWPSGETWTYTYYTSGHAANKLEAVEDSYGRKLQFTYINNTGQYDHLHLWRVGDQTASGLDGGTPAGRYVTFSYSTSKVISSNTISNGTLPGESLLTGVQDVRGQTWSYEYVDDDKATLNFLTRRVSPSVDTNYDSGHQPDGTLELEHLVYTMTGSYEWDLNGDMQDTNDPPDPPVTGWEGIPMKAPDTIEASDSGYGDTSALRVTATADEKGVQSAEWDLEANQVCCITAQVFPENGSVKMQVVDSGGQPITGTIVTSTGTGAWEQLQVDYVPDTAASDVRLQFLTNVANTQFRVDKVSVGTGLRPMTITQERGDGLLSTEFEFNVLDAEGEQTTVETVVEGNPTTHYFERGVYAGAEDPLENRSTSTPDNMFRPSTQEDANGNQTQLNWSGDGKYLNQVTDALENETTFTYDDQDRLVKSVDADSRETAYIYDADERQPTAVIIGADVTDLDINGSMERDSGWSNVGSPTTNDRVDDQTGEVDSGTYSRYVEADQNEGIESVDMTLVGNQSYTFDARVYPGTGQVKMRLVDCLGNEISGAVDTSQGTNAWESLSVTYTPSSDLGGVNLQFLASGGTAEFYVDAVTVDPDDGIALNGDMELESGWAGVNSPAQNKWVGDQVRVDSGSFARHVKAETGDGIQSDAVWDLEANKPCTIRARVYVVHGTVKMQVPGETAFDVQSQAMGTWETLTVTHTPTTGATGKHLQFIATSSEAEFFVDTVSVTVDGEEELTSTMEADSGWSGINTPVLNERTDPRADTGTYTRYVAADTGEGVQSAVTLDVDHTYIAMARVFLTTAKQVKLAVTGGTGFYALASIGSAGQWQTLRAIHKVTAGEAGSQNLQVLAQEDGAEFYLDTVHLIDLGEISGSIEHQVRWQEFKYDLKGRMLEERFICPTDASVISGMERTYYATGTGAGLLKTLTKDDLTTTYRYDEAGRIIQTNKNSTFGGCEIAYTVYDPVGNVVASICNYDPGTQAAPSTAAEATALYDANYPDKNQVTTHEYDALGRRIATTVHAGSAFAQKSLTFYDALDRVWRTIANYAPQGTPATAPGDWEWANGRWEDGSSNAISHGSENNQNIISDTEYNDLGLVRLRRDVLGNVTLYGYDDAGRLVKTIQNASVPTYNNDFSGTTPDPDLSDYTESTSNADQDIITEQEYDAGGNVVKTVGPDGSVTLNGYDVLNRVIKAVQNASAPDYFDTHDDPALSEYDALVNPDEDHITTTEYDAMGRVGQTKRLVETRGGEVWSATYTVYDLLDRPVRTIANYVEQGDPVTAPADWVWANSRWEDGGGNPIDHGTNDQNLITETVYDAAGRVLYTLDMEYNKTWHVYDGLGRQVKTIRNYVVQGSSDPADWVWSEVRERWEYSSSDSTPIDHGDNDLNIITETAYDSDGRVQEIRDVEGKVTRHVYDVLGRRVKTIGNYEAYGETDPADWVWANGLWEDGSSNAIPRGTAFDQNIVAATVYDALERVQSTRDVRGLVPLYGYDSTGRRVKTVQNASNPGYDADSDPDLSGYTASGGPDEDRITTTGYDVAGRVTQVTGPAGIAIRYVYDRLGRRIRVVQNYISNGEDPADWVWDDINDTRWEESDGTPIDHGDNDQNLVSDTAYNKAGQVVATRDTRGTQTTLAYDNAGRRVQVTQAAHTPLETVNYTCFDKAGHVLRTIANANWEPEDNPDEQDTSGDWVWEPYGHGMYEDQNRIVSYEYDAAGRRTKVTDALGNTSETAYGQAGQVLTVTDPEGLVTRHMYDGLKRLKRIIQGYNPPSVLGDKIVFASGSSMVNTRLATVNPDGTNLTYLTGEEGVLGPTWSPNRRKIAFYSYEYPQGLYVIDANGSNRTQLDLDGNNNPVWSPDGNKIAYEVFDSQWDVYMIDADGSNRTRLTNSSGVDWRPSWSPDSGKIVLLANRSANGYDVYVIDADGSNETRLTFSEDVDANWKPRWSPGGGKIAYSKYDEVYVMDADGSNQTRLASGSHPLWSPDGKKIAFIRSAISNYQLFVMDANGENQTYLASNVSSGVSDSRSWSPDGSQICCQKGIAAIYVINADGTGETYLGEGWHPSWAPDYQPTPVDWQWNDSTNRWEESDGTPIVHGTDNDQNVIVDVAYDLAGRKVSQRDPRGNVTEYEYDQLGRRTKLTNPLAKEWTTAYADVTDSGAYTGQTRVALTTPEGYGPTRVYDRLGRMETLEYGSPTNTPDVTFAYDMAGNRSAMTEDDGTNTIRKTDYSYDDVRRLTQVDFDTNGDSTIDETVSYEYGLGGQRTKLTLPGSLDVTYEYDAKGRLVSLTDWDGQQTRLAYDNANRQIALERANGLRTRAVYDVAGRLRKLRHDKSGRTLAHFAYEVDKRGNRTQALECLPHPATTNDTVYAYDDASIVYHGVWSDSSPYKVTSSYASLGVGFFGTQAELIVGKGPDHGIFDVYVDGALWRSFDGYDASTGDLNPIQLNLDGEGPHVLELRNRGEKRPDSTGTALRFKQLTVADLAYDLWTIEYSYDALARLTEARTNPGIRTGAPDADLLRRYQYSFDLTGNRLSMSEALAGGAPTVVNYSYNEANQIMNQNFTYDDNGNLTDDGTNSYVWDRAGRLKEWDNSDPLDKTEYDYDGLGNRISQAIGTSNPTVIQYLLDLQPGLPVMLAQMTGSNTDRFVHLTGHGILAQEDNVGTWTWPVADGLRSVRSVVDDTLNVDSVESYEPFGKPLDGGVFGSPFMFTGEPLDANGLVYLRARYYVPELGAFPSLDPVENLNRYQYVAGNVVNHTDPSGLQGGADTLLGACATLVATPFDFGIVGDIGCVAVIAGLVLAGEIDWQEVAETSEELWERVLDELDIDWDWDLDPGPEPVPLPDLEEVFPPIGIDIDENDRRRRREGPCPTNDPPGSTRPFDIDREIEDIICNIRRYTASSGPQPADWWTGFGGRVSPVFVNALVGQQAMFVGKRSSKAREVLDDGTTRRSIFLSRMMVIPRPGQYGSGEPQTRADIMTFVVHELRHAGQYFSFFSEEIVGGHPLECQNITCRVAEVDAWLKTNHWMVHSVQASRLNTSDFNASINFFNSGNLWTEADLWDHEIMRVYRRILGEGFDLSAYECPGNTAHQSNQNSFCLNALVARHL